MASDEVIRLEASVLRAIGRGEKISVPCPDDEGEAYTDCLWIVTKWALEGSPIRYDWDGKAFTFHPREL